MFPPESSRYLSTLPYIAINNLFHYLIHTSCEPLIYFPNYLSTYLLTSYLLINFYTYMISYMLLSIDNTFPLPTSSKLPTDWAPTASAPHSRAPGVARPPGAVASGAARGARRGGRRCKTSGGELGKFCCGCFEWRLHRIWISDISERWLEIWYSDII